RRSPRSPTPCSRSPTRFSTAASLARTSAPTSTPGVNHPPSARPTWSASSKASPPLRHHHHHQPAGGRLNTPPQPQAPMPRSPEPPPARHPGPAGQTNLIPHPCHRSGQGSLPRAHRDPVFVSGVLLKHFLKPCGVLRQLPARLAADDKRDEELADP